MRTCEPFTISRVLWLFPTLNISDCILKIPYTLYHVLHSFLIFRDNIWKEWCPCSKLIWTHLSEVLSSSTESLIRLELNQLVTLSRTLAVYYWDQTDSVNKNAHQCSDSPFSIESAHHLAMVKISHQQVTIFRCLYFTNVPSFLEISCPNHQSLANLEIPFYVPNNHGLCNAR